jgi:pimeloyl-ACP methyl ester carboxylesterase
MNATESSVDVAAPEFRLLIRELWAPLEIAKFLWTVKRLRDLPRGDGHAVMLIPGFGVTDGMLRPLATAIEQLGYSVHGWGEGRNLGMRPRIKQNLAQRLNALYERHDGPVSLIGWSLGGVFARELARAQPALVRRVFTLGSPINGHPAANNMNTLFRLANRGKPVKLDMEGFQRRKLAPPVPCTAVYSKTDGIVAWRACLEEPAKNTENVEVTGSHFSLPFNVQVVRVVAERLARPVKRS